MEYLFNQDCLEFLNSDRCKELTKDRQVIIVTDPPFNIGYHYSNYKDNMKEEEYYNFLETVFTKYNFPFVVIHYPEALYKLSFQVGLFPEKVVSWVYNSNTAKQHRDIAFFGIKPDFTQIKQPYKNPNDKRIKERIANGKLVGRLYDWWNINQVKNVSKNGGGVQHPCVMPLQVMENIIGILPRNALIMDLFMGSGTTGLACKKYRMDFIGVELDKDYYELAKKRISEYASQTTIFDQCTKNGTQK